MAGALYAPPEQAGADLKALAEELSGHDLTAFWQDWILETGKPAWPEKLGLALAASPATGLRRRAATRSRTR